MAAERTWVNRAHLFDYAADGPIIADAVAMWNADGHVVNDAPVKFRCDVVCSTYEVEPGSTSPSGEEKVLSSHVVLDVTGEVGWRRVRDNEYVVPVETLRTTGVPYPMHLMWALKHRPPFGMERMFQAICAKDFDDFTAEAHALEVSLWDDGHTNSFSGRNKWMYTAAKHAIYAAGRIRRDYFVGAGISCICVGTTGGAGRWWISAETAQPGDSDNVMFEWRLQLGQHDEIATERVPFKTVQSWFLPETYVVGKTDAGGRRSMWCEHPLTAKRWVYNADKEIYLRTAHDDESDELFALDDARCSIGQSIPVPAAWLDILRKHQQRMNGYKEQLHRCIEMAIAEFAEKMDVPTSRIRCALLGALMPDGRYEANVGYWMDLPGIKRFGIDHVVVTFEWTLQSSQKKMGTDEDTKVQKERVSRRFDNIVKRDGIPLPSDMHTSS